MFWVIFGIIVVAILGMIWIGKEAYKQGEKNTRTSDTCKIHALKKEIIDMKHQMIRINNVKNNWELRFEEMETHWRDCKKRREELRLEKLELEARLSDALASNQK